MKALRMREHGSLWITSLMADTENGAPCWHIAMQEGYRNMRHTSYAETDCAAEADGIAEFRKRFPVPLAPQREAA